MWFKKLHTVFLCMYESIWVYVLWWGFFWMISRSRFWDWQHWEDGGYEIWIYAMCVHIQVLCMKASNGICYCVEGGCETCLALYLSCVWGHGLVNTGLCTLHIFKLCSIFASDILSITIFLKGVEHKVLKNVCLTLVMGVWIVCIFPLHHTVLISV